MRKGHGDHAARRSLLDLPDIDLPCPFFMILPGGFFKFAEPLVVSMAKRAYEADLHNLKEMLEAQAVQVA